MCSPEKKGTQKLVRSSDLQTTPLSYQKEDQKEGAFQLPEPGVIVWLIFKACQTAFGFDHLKQYLVARAHLFEPHSFWSSLLLWGVLYLDASELGLLARSARGPQAQQ